MQRERPLFSTPCCDYLRTNSSTDSHSPVAGLTQQRVLNACNCGNSGSTTSAATTVKTSAKTTTTVKTTTKTTTKTSTKTTAKTTTTSKKPTTTTAVQSSVYNPDSQIDYTPAPVAWVLRTVSDNNTLDDLYVVVQNASNSVSSLGLGSQTQATNFYVQESFLQVYTNPSSNLPQWAVAVNGNGSQSGQMVFSTNNNEDYWMSNSVNCFVTDESSVYCVSASGLPYYSYVNSKTLTVSFFTSPTPPSGYQAVHLELDVGPYYFYLMDAYNFDSMVLASSNASTGKALDKLSLIGPMEGGAGSAKFYFERVTASIREATTNWPLSMLQPSGKIAFVNPQYAAELNGTMMVAFVNPWDGSLMITDSTVTDFYGIYYNGTSPTGFELINVNSNATGYTYETLLGFYPSPPIGHNTVVYTNAGS